ncbi:MAG TPA: hypothetical protein VG265_14220 [Gaiellaceae bacterium]|jgi:hypothetical protein|nr:hypothetical protein [Gaiellaceae bacterium]
MRMDAGIAASQIELVARKRGLPEARSLLNQYLSRPRQLRGYTKTQALDDNARLVTILRERNVPIYG